MNGDEMTAGSIAASQTERRLLAAKSRWWNSTGGGSGTENPRWKKTEGEGRKGKGTGTGGAARKSGGIFAGDGGKRFREEWPEEDEENWSWMEEVGVDPATGKVVPKESVEGEAEQECGPEVARWREILSGAGGSAGGTLSRRAREVGEGWIGRWKWWMLGGVVVYLLASRVLFAEDA
jgi:ubiquitin-conjugating enzyme E2 J2